jgi:hypothetical protein
VTIADITSQSLRKNWVKDCRSRHNFKRLISVDALFSAGLLRCTKMAHSLAQLVGTEIDFARCPQERYAEVGLERDFR